MWNQYCPYAICESVGKERLFKVYSEIIAALAVSQIESGDNLASLPSRILGVCRGIVACALVLPKLGKLLLFPNN